MRLSRYFLPVTKETPADAQIVSHKLMLRAGLVRQTPPASTPGCRSACACCARSSASCARSRTAPARRAADADHPVGRPVAPVRPLRRLRPGNAALHDRHKREMLYGPTNEEMITAIFRDAVKSYRDLPRTLYHIQWKFRDEVRPASASCAAANS
jgi:prolyl-tRNA synthetase